MYKKISILIVFIAIINSSSSDDKIFIPLYLNGIKTFSEEPTYHDELNLIIEVQKSV